MGAADMEWPGRIGGVLGSPEKIEKIEKIGKIEKIENYESGKF